MRVNIVLVSIVGSLNALAASALTELLPFGAKDIVETF